jgi:hypothetical protein
LFRPHVRHCSDWKKPAGYGKSRVFARDGNGAALGQGRLGTSDLQEQSMGYSRPWKVALLAVFIAMMVGFAWGEHQKKQAADAAGSEAMGDDAAEEEPQDDDGQAAETVSQFLTDLVSDGEGDQTADGLETAPPVPAISDLPPLPAAYWPTANLFTQASTPGKRTVRY